MPYRKAIIGHLELVEIDRDGPIPAFVGQIQGRNLIVRFDVAALAKLTGTVGNGGAVVQALAGHTSAIKTSAQALLKGGFWTETDDGIEILVTALDV